MTAASLVSAEEALYDLTITRIFDAPRELVYEAFTNPEHARQWMGPRAFTATRYELDARPGGLWRTNLRQTSEWNGVEYPDLGLGGVFQELDPPRRLVYTFAWEGQGRQPTRETLITVTFEELSPTRTEMTFHQAFFDDAIQRDGHVEGWNSAFDRLYEFFTASQQGEHMTAAGSFNITRTFSASREVIFACFTQAEHLVHWWGPAGFIINVPKVDLRPGGLFLYSMNAPEGHPMGNVTVWGRFVYQEIVPPERIVFLNSFSDAEGGITVHPMNAAWPRQVRNVLTLTEQEGKTTVSLTGTPWEATAEEQTTFDANHASLEQGFGGTFSQLETYLETLARKPKETAMQASPYLTFPGTCKEALTFYETTLNAKILFMMPHKGSPMEQMGGPEWGDAILHATLKIGETLVFASDAPPGSYEKPTGISVSLNLFDVAEAERIYAAFSDGATIRMPLQETFWATRFAMLTDRFGIPWLINCEKPMP